MTALADAWLAADPGWSTGTARVYRSVVRAQVNPALGSLYLREVTAGAISRALTTMAKQSGPGTAMTARACLPGCSPGQPTWGAGWLM